MNNLINELKIKINNLNNKILEVEKKEQEYSQNTEKIRLFIVRNIIIGGLIHMIGYFTSLYLTLGGLLFVCFSVIPFGIIYLHRENVDDKFRKEIDNYNEELKKLNQDLEQYTNSNYMEPLKIINKETKKNTANLFLPNNTNSKKENSRSKQKKS